MSAINKTLPRKLKISSLSVKNENECFPSSKYQIESAIKKEIRIRITGKIRQQYFLFSIDFNVFSVKREQKNFILF